jgi:hypothetical protein
MAPRPELRRALRWLADGVRERPWEADDRPAPTPERPPSILLVKTPPWDTRLPPLGITYLSAYLRRKGLDAELWDANIDTYLRYRMDREDLWDMEAAVFWFTPERVAEVFNHEADLVARRKPARPTSASR